MRIVPTLVLAATLAGLGAAASRAADHALPPPRNLPTTQPTPEAHPYPVDADAKASVAAAFAEAKRSDRDVLIVLGANWCPDCRMLGGVMQMNEVKPWIDSRFVPVSVNVDHLNQNMDIPARYGVHVTQIPTVLVVTPAGKLLNPDGATTLGNARTMTPQADVDLLATWEGRGS